MTLIDKYPLDRMRGRGMRISFDCPYCQGARIELKDVADLAPMEGVRCFKCKALILLDSLSVTVIREPVPHATEG
ncbi:MAG TPA: hypothetical protein VGR51_07265 [Thermoplasmata archaeon]|nr:hypothetical protein [Thermoplasmata archaeon]